MRFDYGPTREEVRRELSLWHRWFAWHPVRISSSHEGVWLEWVERKMWEDYPGQHTEYRNIQEDVKND